MTSLDGLLETVLLELGGSAGPPSPGFAGYFPDFAGKRLQKTTPHPASPRARGEERFEV
jgi:hypothetical protein